MIGDVPRTIGVSQVALIGLLSFRRISKVPREVVSETRNSAEIEDEDGKLIDFKFQSFNVSRLSWANF